MSHPIIVTVSGDTVDEIRSKLVQLAVQFGHDDKQQTLPLTPPTSTVTATVSPTAEKRGRGRPPSAEKSSTTTAGQSGTPLEEKATEPTSATAAATPATATKEQVVAALQKLQGAVNLKAVIEVLGKFGSKNASGLKAEDYASVVAECNQKVSEAATAATA